MVSDRSSRSPERPGNQDQQTGRRDSRSRSRSLERMRREGGMQSDQPENLQRSNETLLDQLRPHLSDQFRDQLHFRRHGSNDLIYSPHKINYALNVIKDTIHMQTQQRHERNQQAINDAPPDIRRHVGFLLIRDEMDHVLNETNSLSLMEQHDARLSWLDTLSTENRQAFHAHLLRPGIDRLREEISNLSDAVQRQRWQEWLSRIPAQYRAPYARTLGEFNPEQQRLILRDQILELMALGDTMQIRVQWQNVRREIPADMISAIEGLRAERETEISNQTMQIFDQPYNQNTTIQNLLDVWARSRDISDSEEMQAVLDEINRQINQQQ